MNKRTYFLFSNLARNNAAAFCKVAPHGLMVTFQEASKSRIQEEKYHAMITDISRQVRFNYQYYDAEDWKRLLIDAFVRVKLSLGEPIKDSGRVLPSLDGTGVVQLGVQSRRFKKSEANDFIEYLYSYGSENGVEWSGAKIGMIQNRGGE